MSNDRFSKNAIILVSIAFCLMLSAKSYAQETTGKITKNSSTYTLTLTKNGKQESYVVTRPMTFNLPGQNIPDDSGAWMEKHPNGSATVYVFGDNNTVTTQEWTADIVKSMEIATKAVNQQSGKPFPQPQDYADAINKMHPTYPASITQSGGVYTLTLTRNGVQEKHTVARTLDPEEDVEEITRMMEGAPGYSGMWREAYVKNGQRFIRDYTYAEGKATFLAEEPNEYPIQTNKQKLTSNQKNSFQQPVDEKSAEDVDKPARYKAGEQMWRLSLMNVGRGLAETAILDGAPAGTYSVKVQFTVDLRGNITDVKALEVPQSCPSCSTAAEVLPMSVRPGSWEPAIRHGEKIVSTKTATIPFTIEAPDKMTGDARILKELVGKWKLISWKTSAGQEMDIVGQYGTDKIYQIFKEDGRCESVIGDQTNRGRWQLSADSKKLTVSTLVGNAVFDLDYLDKSRTKISSQLGLMEYVKE